MLILKICGGIILAYTIIRLWNWASANRARGRLIRHRYAAMAKVLDAEIGRLFDDESIDGEKIEISKEKTIEISKYISQVHDTLKKWCLADCFGKSPPRESFGDISDAEYQDYVNKFIVLVISRIATEDYTEL